ncbi:MAG: DUF4392 domain-containing protein [Chloroflexota bacterium]|nr:DUF4392 domain-containing protein [Chloroflexota bacterium]MDE2968856.1 DUF4392 domain-containing protein [Chloroflexota bacterium]
MTTIEDIILRYDKRGMTPLRPHLPEDYCTRAARCILDAPPGRALIATGFYITRAGATETDGPPGAYFIGKALEVLGRPVTYVTDRLTTPVFEGLVPPDAVVDFPFADAEASEAFAVDLLARLQPTVAIAIERCGFTGPGRYLNMRGQDTSEYHAKLDYIFMHHGATVGIGDGGNEIGMGNLAEHIPSVEQLPNEPCVTTVSELIIASVSNWGGYGLVAALSLQAGRNLLPSPDEEEDVIRAMVDRGAVDGVASASVYGVDGFTLQENRRTLEALHLLLAEHGVGE